MRHRGLWGEGLARGEWGCGGGASGDGGWAGGGVVGSREWGAGSISTRPRLTRTHRSALNPTRPSQAQPNSRPSRGVKVKAENPEDAAYDVAARELGFESKGAATEPTLTPEELLEQERQRLERLEKERIKRMRGGGGRGGDSEDEDEEDEGEDEDEEEGGRRKRRKAHQSGGCFVWVRVCLLERVWGQGEVGERRCSWEREV